MKTLSRIDTAMFALLTLFLLAVVAVSGMANLQTDAIDYYAMVQRLVGDAPPIVPNLPFIEQRSPGYPLLMLPLYFALGSAPAVETKITPKPSTDAPAGGATLTGEAALLPPAPSGYAKFSLMILIYSRWAALCAGVFWRLCC